MPRWPAPAAQWHTERHAPSYRRAPAPSSTEGTLPTRTPYGVVTLPPMGWGEALTDREGGEDPVAGEALGLAELVVDVPVELLHAPHRVLLQEHVQGALLLHELGGRVWRLEAISPEPPEALPPWTSGGNPGAETLPNTFFHGDLLGPQVPSEPLGGLSLDSPLQSFHGDLWPLLEVFTETPSPAPAPPHTSSAPSGSQAAVGGCRALGHVTRCPAVAEGERRCQQQAGPAQAPSGLDSSGSEQVCTGLSSLLLSRDLVPGLPGGPSPGWSGGR